MPTAVAESLRALRFMQNVPGWRRVVATLSPPRDEPFEVTTDGVTYAGSLASYVDREVWFYGRYENDLINLFLAAVPMNRRRVCLDIGGNAGNHSLAFGGAFAIVHTFEPNPEVLPQLRHNVSLNAAMDIRVHPIGLGNEDGEIPFYNIGNGNLGLGTFSPVEQYDQPLVHIGEAKIRRGDDVVRDLEIGPVDAMKIDVQGLEPEVLRGLAVTLARDLPVVWLEVAAGTQSSMARLADLEALFPYPISVEIMEGGTVKPVLETGNYLVYPA